MEGGGRLEGRKRGKRKWTVLVGSREGRKEREDWKEGWKKWWTVDPYRTHYPSLDRTLQELQIYSNIAEEIVWFPNLRGWSRRDA